MTTSQLQTINDAHGNVTSVIVPIGLWREIQKEQETSGSKESRPMGLCKGQFQVPDDFDAPLPDEILNGFEGL